ncbi:DUF1330 domain-containing protein [Falsihalocynthiibacter sp. SS001]|uniref:DUF1330 domain-containing protein n=1 Tax=Falsihalocynthiibacter sp. SS001 TaxID=3349698 RepID=UPI0036D433D1
MTDTPKGYWVAHVDVRDPDEYKKYVAANATAFAEFGGRFLIRGAEQDVVEGQLRSRTVIVEFPDLAAAKACYESEAYREAKALRDPVSDADLTIIEGWGG